MYSQAVPCMPCTATLLCQTPGPWWPAWVRGRAAPSPPVTTNCSSLEDGTTRTKSSPRWCAGTWAEGCWQRSVFYLWECRTTAVWHSWSPTHTYTESQLQRANDTGSCQQDIVVAERKKKWKKVMKGDHFWVHCYVPLMSIYATLKYMFNVILQQ